MVEKWLLKAAERNSVEAMYLLGKLCREPFGCSFDDSWYPGNVSVQELVDDTKMMQYADGDAYYRHVVLEAAEERIRKEEFVRNAMLIKHSHSERKDLAKKAAGGDGKAGELLVKSYIPIVAGQRYKRYPGQWILRYKSYISKLTDDVCIRHIMEEKENGTKRFDTGRSS